MKRCIKCILPEHAPDISFDPKGVCNYCRTYRKIEYRGEEKLLRLLASHKKKDKKYDCIVLLSGGRDSTYTLLKMVKDYRMKVLALNYENPFTDPQAEINIQNAVKILKVDLVRFKIKKQIHQKSLKNNLIQWFKKPSPGLVPIICIGCKTIWWDIIKIAKKYQVGLIVSGGNLFEQVSFKRILLGVEPSENVEKALIKSFWGIIRECLKNLGYLKPQFLPTMIKGYLFGNPYTLGSRLWGRDLSRIDLFHFIRWDEKEVIQRIKSELEWDHPREFNSSWRFDCRVEHLKDLMYIKTLGMTQRDDLFSKMIREGMISRDEALLRLNAENQLHMNEIKALLKELGIKNTSFLTL